MIARTSRASMVVGVAALASLGAGCRQVMIDALPGTGGVFFGQGGGFDCGSLTNGAGGSNPPFDPMRATNSTPSVEPLVTAAVPPPPISGGTLIVLSDGVTSVASDPDRDRVYVIDIPTSMVTASVALNPHDEPGRLVEDGSGLVHVALRGGSAIATLDPRAGKLTARRSACLLPRGIAYDAAKDVLYVACSGGSLLTFTPTGAAGPIATWTLQPDLRDVIVDGPRLLVTRFRTAEVLVLDETGQTSEVLRPASFTNILIHGGTMFDPAVAWRAVPLPGGGAVMVHQRGMRGTIVPSAGGYGGLGPCDTIVHTCVSRMKRGMAPVAGPAMPGFVLPVDIAVSADGKQLALVAAGNGHASVPGGARRLWLTDLNSATASWTPGCSIDDMHGPDARSACHPGAANPQGSVTGGVRGAGGAGGMGGQKAGGGGGLGDSSGPRSSNGVAGSNGSSGSDYGVNCRGEVAAAGEPVAVAFAGPTVVLVQMREPAQLVIVRDAGFSTQSETVVPLSSDSRADTGHTLFHCNSGGGLACASCHPEGHDDGRTWDFACEGQRRTQDPSGGLLGTEPFHWNGDMKDFPTLVSNVFVQRMSGPILASDQVGALQGWVNSIPTKPPLRSATDVQVMRGQTLFQSPTVGCTTCHAGAAFTSNASVSVGTNGMFQVPSLRGVGWRAPYLHDGCAGSLADRFSDVTCGGGDAHGLTSNLSSSETADLIAFLQSL